jgi:uncharacterized phage protein gp47/JayE
MAAATPSFNDLVAIGIAEAQDVRPALVFAKGDQSTAIVRAGAAMCDHVLGWFAGEIRKMFFGGAVGDELDTIIMDRTQIARIPASTAYGSIVFSRASSGTAETVPGGTQLATAPDATGATSTYLTDHDLAYPATSFSLSVAATCALAGPSGNLDAIAISDPSLLKLSIIDTLDDPAIEATSSGFAGGNDVESDEHYLQRVISSWLTQRGATLPALERGAFEVGGVAVAHAVENYETGIVTVKVADEAGGSTDEMEQAANVALKEWRAAGVDVQAKGQHPSLLNLTIWIVDYAPGFDVEAATPTMADSVVNRLAEMRPGETLYLDEIRTAVIAPYATQIYKIAFADPVWPHVSGVTLDGVALLDSTADIVPADGRAIHLRAITFVDAKVTP